MTKGNNTCRRHPIPTDIIAITVQDKPFEARKRVLNTIQNLLDTHRSMFPSIGMKLPISWLEFISCVESMTSHSPDDHSNLDKSTKKLKKRDMKLMVNAMATTKKLFPTQCCTCLFISIECLSWRRKIKV